MRALLPLPLIPVLWSGSASQDLKVYGSKSGIIEYRHSGTTVGTSTLYFDDYGNSSAVYADMTEVGSPRKGWVPTRGVTQYMWSPGEPTGLKTENPVIGMLKETGDVEKFTEKMFSSMGLSASGTQKFLARDCRAFAGKSGKVLTWKGLLMLMDMDVVGQKMKQEAT